MHVSALQKHKYSLPLGVVHSRFRALMRALYWLCTMFLEADSAPDQRGLAAGCYSYTVH